MNMGSKWMTLGNYALRTAAMLLLLAFTQSKAWADLHFIEPVADAGQIRAGAPLKHQFAFVNGETPVELLGLRGSCGCLSPHSEKRVFGPGEKGGITLDVHTLGQSQGPHRWRVTVTYQSDNTTYEMPLILSASLLTEISVQPAALTIFADHAVSQEISLFDTRPQPLAVTRLEASSPHLHAQVVSDSRGRSQPALRTLRLDVLDDYPGGRHAEVLHVYTDDPQYQDLTIPVTVIKRSRQRLSAAPRQISLEILEGQDTVAQIVVLRDRDNQKVTVDEVTSDDSALNCRWTSGPGSMATLKVSLDRQKAAMSQQTTAIHIHISQPVRETLTVPVNISLH
jgi:hypothetical protein